MQKIFFKVFCGGRTHRLWRPSRSETLENLQNSGFFRFFALRRRSRSWIGECLPEKKPSKKLSPRKNREKLSKRVLSKDESPTPSERGKRPRNVQLLQTIQKSLISSWVDPAGQLQRCWRSSQDFRVEKRNAARFRRQVLCLRQESLESCSIQ